MKRSRGDGLLLMETYEIRSKMLQRFKKTEKDANIRRSKTDLAKEENNLMDRLEKL